MMVKLGDFRRKFINSSTAIILLIVGSLLISVLIELYCNWFYELGNHAKDRAVNHPILMLISTPLFFWISWTICKNYATNARACNVDFGLDLAKNIPKTTDKSAPTSRSNLEIAADQLNLKTALAIALSSLVATYSAGSLGREGTSIQIATILLICFANFYKSKLGKIRLESLIYGGFALGFAIAFNSPIVACVYATEKMGKKLFLKSQRYLLRTVAAIAFIGIIFHIFFEQKAVYFVHEIDLDLSKNFGILIIISLASGSIAAVFRKTCQLAFGWASELSDRKQHLVPIICGFTTSLIAMRFGVYSFGGGIRTVNDALSSNHAILGFHDVFGRIASTFFTFVAGCAGGLVAPAIAIGATFGSAMSFFSTDSSNLACILTGMTAFLSPILRAPLAAALVIITASGQNFSILPFLVLVSILSSLSYKIIDSITTYQLFFKKLK